ncbi:MAG: glycogen debranching protein GlgX [Saprospiraceae bacterium]|nr:glycogen debranching protein GlgX [Saprospiraceae bacterium]
MKKIKVLPGQSFPLGATLYEGGVNFSVFSKNCERVELLLFDKKDHSAPQYIIPLNSQTNRTFYYWHAFIPGLRQGQLYGYRVYGSFEPKENGNRFNGRKILVDPYAKAVLMETYNRQAAVHADDNCREAIKSVVVDEKDYDWEEDRPLKIPLTKSVIYELHVGGFTKHPNSGLPENLRGTYTGLIEKIPYLKKLGITTVELLPIQQFDPMDAPESLTNYWGYSSIAFFSPHNGYGTSNDPIATLAEFKDMVKALHKAGIEIILDVVFNHTAEGNENGPTLSFKGFENKGYYILDDFDQAFYKNYSGTGNTLKTNLSIVRRMILDCLRYWVSEMHVDGFRFDLATVMSRGFYGSHLQEPPVLWEIESDPVLASTKIIAEPWDVSSYQMGFFVGHKWAEWNDRFRDDVRRFLKGDRGVVAHFANRLTGSHDLFNDHKRDPHRSINFITGHDGFTLYDLVSYNYKHNLKNRENNQDGSNNNHSWNCGAEGPTEIPAVNQLRNQQMKNLLTVLMISQGTPMLLMGDEVKRTQKGNNNAYCQDNEISWFDWSLLDQEKALLRFIQHLIKLTGEIEFFNESDQWTSIEQPGRTHISWHGVKLEHPDWSDISHSLSFTLKNPAYSYVLHIMVNAFWEPLTFEIPSLTNKKIKSWNLLIDTSAESPNDFYNIGTAPAIEGSECLVSARSMVLLYGH